MSREDLMVLYIEPCEAVSELEVFLGQSSDVWDEIPMEKDLCCGIKQSLKKNHLIAGSAQVGIIEQLLNTDWKK